MFDFELHLYKIIYMYMYVPFAHIHINYAHFQKCKILQLTPNCRYNIFSPCS